MTWDPDPLRPPDPDPLPVAEGCGASYHRGPNWPTAFCYLPSGHGSIHEWQSLPVVARQGCARWWLLWLAVGAAFWAIVIALIVANRAAPRSESQPVEAQVPPSQQVAPATVGALSGAPLTLSGPVESHPADRKVPLGGAPAHGASLTPPSLPAVAARPQPSRARESAPVTIRGFATWCGPTPTQCQGWGGDAMLGAVPSFRWGDEPYRVRVTRGERSVVVTVVSFCACRDRHGLPTLVDLSPAAFRQLGPLSRGVLRVELEELP